MTGMPVRERPRPPLRERRSARRATPSSPSGRWRRCGGWPATSRRPVAGCGWSVAAREHGRVATLYDESPEILAYLEQWTAPTKVAHAGRARQLRSRAVGLPARARRDADPAHLHPARRTCSDGCNLSLPELLRGVSSPALAGVVPVAEVLANVDTATGPRGRPARRADALGRRADPPPASCRPPRPRSSSATSPASWSTPTASRSPRTTRCSTCCTATAAGSRSTCSSTASAWRPTATTAGPTCARIKHAGDRAAVRGAGSSPRSP